MNLAPYEIEVLKLMLISRLTLKELDDISSNCSISNYEYTGAGYFLELKCKNLNLIKETIHGPVVFGRTKDLDVGFLLFVNGDTIIIECHSWGDINPPENIRDLKLEITIEKK